MTDYGFIRVGAATPKVKVADPIYNAEQICKCIDDGFKEGIKVLVFPELCITSYTCGDLFLQGTLLERAKAELKHIIEHSKGKDMLIAAGLPWSQCGKLYNAAAIIHEGKLLGIVPKKNLPNYSEFYEARYFYPGQEEPVMIDWEGDKIPFGMKLLFFCEENPELVVAAEICEDLWVAASPGISHTMAGATVLVNCSASDETAGKEGFRRQLVTGASSRLVCGYVYANAGDGESTQDLVFGGHNIIAENGNCLKESVRFTGGIICADLDMQRIDVERRRMNTHVLHMEDGYKRIGFSLKHSSDGIRRPFNPSPFVPADTGERTCRCEEILTIQAMGLKKRLEHTNCRQAVLGISGGLDSTLALLVTARAFSLLHIPASQILCVTMPCFGTTDRTYKNACLMTEKLGATLKEIDIKDSVTQHFKDIGHNPSQHDVTYENAQARERTQVLMDIANQTGALVVGTGDMSELALGWATYNGDHMSMYGVNASVPKTLVRHLVEYYAEHCSNAELKAVLLDVIGTPVSPELLPPKEGKISQITEDLVGPYELHDYFLFQVLRYGYAPSKVYVMAVCAFEGSYGNDVILKWLKVFYRRFFSQQFKRSCLPDGPKVGTVALSPRGDLRMPSDASGRIWLEELETLE